MMLEDKNLTMVNFNFSVLIFMLSFFVLCLFQAITRYLMWALNFKWTCQSWLLFVSPFSTTNISETSSLGSTPYRLIACWQVGSVVCIVMWQRLQLSLISSLCQISWVYDYTHYFVIYIMFYLYISTFFYYNFSSSNIFFKIFKICLFFENCYCTLSELNVIQKETIVDTFKQLLISPVVVIIF